MRWRRAAQWAEALMAAYLAVLTVLIVGGFLALWIAFG